MGWELGSPFSHLIHPHILRDHVFNGPVEPPQNFPPLPLCSPKTQTRTCMAAGSRGCSPHCGRCHPSQQGPSQLWPLMSIRQGFPGAPLSLPLCAGPEGGGAAQPGPPFLWPQAGRMEAGRLGWKTLVGGRLELPSPGCRTWVGLGTKPFRDPWMNPGGNWGMA